MLPPAALDVLGQPAPDRFEFGRTVRIIAEAIGVSLAFWLGPQVEGRLLEVLRYVRTRIVAAYNEIRNVGDGR